MGGGVMRCWGGGWGGRVCVGCFCFKQKTAYEIGLGIPAEPLFRSEEDLQQVGVGAGLDVPSPQVDQDARDEIGRASGGERGEISGGAVSLKKKNTRRHRTESGQPHRAGRRRAHTTTRWPR